MSVAFVFPGQGSQQVGMGRALRDAFPESRAVIEEADATLGFALSELCFQGPEGELQLTANTQPAILAASVAALRPLVARGVRPAWVAGHSLGEYSALVAAGTLSLADALRTVRRRGQYMQEAVPVGAGAMAAILGLDLPSIEAACRDAAEGEVVSPANVNSPGQVVIAGHAAAVDRASELCRARGAKRAVRLPVSAPFHCALMKPAQERLASRARRAGLPGSRGAPGEQRGRAGGTGRFFLPGRPRAPGLGGGALAGIGRAPRQRGRDDLRRGRAGQGPERPGQEDRAGDARVLNVDSPESLEADGRRPRGGRGGVMGQLEGRVSLVTGASRGIGRAIAKALAAEGAHVVLAARDAAKLAEAVAEIAAAGGRAEALALDVADRASVEAAFAHVLAAHGRIDHLVNNAGVTRDNLLLRMKDEEWQQVLATNLTGAFLCTQAALKPMLKQRAGRIVNITSVVGLGGNAGPGQLRRQQGRDRGLHEVGGPRGGLARHHRERGRPRLHRDRHDRRHDRQGPRGRRLAPSPWAGWDAPRTWPGRSSSSSPTPPPT